ncbi:GAF domain-containing protein [Gluconacetobacter entanii]|uniref:GAF domain-containing protein n=1 Tax=Gluconacetobacter entanii TaxID=108528 RepID=UPI001C935F5D|nr:GAF domain-containing protein [Gluconacetobacter entanii]MBY4639307.1 GAF domain-containing protein [Gluconacetobacter entanii]MCW4580419.1 GAF domain-containing protein [Gluconacetobacter entanii]MCW4583734.1 GAF domain-containing protein [Gluconacetobacter entanii]MCW4587081.1 GAF domain-containing protein [Gluconacetobacter entanii]
MTVHTGTSATLGEDEIVATVAAITEGEGDPIANAANIAAILFEGLADINWAGFYFLRDGQLVLGPFQGRVACTRIAMGKGVCGTAAQQRMTVVVPDVHAFAGHIACDAASRSEIVVPIVDGDRLLGVIDIDSPSLARFTQAHAALIEQVAALYVRACGGEVRGRRE